jgi:ribonuclease HII
MTMGASRFKFERELLQQGVERIAGLDEAGRGPLAGPVVAGAVIFPSTWIRDGLPRSLHGLTDSKQLSAEERDRFYARITCHPAVQWAVAIVAVEVIDRINILQASLQAMNDAWKQLQPPPQHGLVDGPHISTLHLPQTPLVEGDSRSYSIAAASVLAKVTRDRLMLDYDARFPAYGFAQHKGYGTPQHLQALQTHGPSPLHRRSFAPLRQPHPELFTQPTL